MMKFIGLFYLKRTDSGNLLGEYCNNSSKCKGLYTECAVRCDTSEAKEQIVGKYLSTWHEHDGEVISAKLEIKKEGDGFFSVVWGCDRKKPLFSGQAMFHDGMLSGSYRKGP